MKKRISMALLSFLTLSPLLLYQNCGNEQTGSLYNKSNQYDFPYQLKLDQVAYMSCAEQNGIPNDPGVFFTFRAGAYGDTSGLRITDKFNYDLRREKNEIKMMELQDDLASQNTRIQFSLRKQGSLQRMFITNNSRDGLEGEDYDYTFGVISSSEMLASLLTLPQPGWLNYWAAGGINIDAYFEGTLEFNDGEKLAQDTRNFLTTGGGVLVAGFVDPAKPETLRTPYNYTKDENDDEDEPSVIPSNVGFGTALRVTFKQPNPLLHSFSGVPHLKVPKRILSTVQEFDLASPATAQSAWTCPQTMQLMIVFPEDIGIIDSNICTLADDSDTVANPPALLEIARRSLPVSDWYINLQKRCIVPKRYTNGSCYGIDTAVTKLTNNIEYDFNKECSPDVQSNRTNPDGTFIREPPPDGSPPGTVGPVSRLKVCPHFASICYKTE
ncbi:MAG: hypothetical protein K2Q26_02555 [Bdellovibrionales bacterium]|nr:hypothetical protein [Bdellovibrionales bacterium]